MKDQFEGDRSSRLHDDDLQQLRQRRLTEPDAVLRIVLCIRVQLNVVAQLCFSLHFVDMKRPSTERRI